MNPLISLPSGEKVPRLGQGTWNMGRRFSFKNDVAALREGIALGMTLIDTAEMYGAAEDVCGEATQGLRDQVFLVSKVQAHNAHRRGVLQACERSLRKNKTDRFDLYLLHWPSRTPIEETIEAFETLKSQGKIRYWGVSNFDLDQMEEVTALPTGKTCAVNQILYNLIRRGPEYELAPWLEEHRIPLMAYSPVQQGSLRVTRALKEVAERHDVTPYALAIAWVLNQPNTIAIPKAGTIAHVRENAEAMEVKLSAEDFAALDEAFKPPRRSKPLDML